MVVVEEERKGFVSLMERFVDIHCGAKSKKAGRAGKATRRIRLPHYGDHCAFGRSKSALRLSLTERASFNPSASPTLTSDEIMATQSTSGAGVQNIYEELEKYPWDNDKEFQVCNPLSMKSEYQPRLFPYSVLGLEA